MEHYSISFTTCHTSNLSSVAFKFWSVVVAGNLTDRLAFSSKILMIRRNPLLLQQMMSIGSTKQPGKLKLEEALKPNSRNKPCNIQVQAQELTEVVFINDDFSEYT